MKITKIKIKDINRFKAFCFMVGFFAVILVQSRFTYSYNPPKLEKVVVQDGENLWTIAQRYKDSKEDTRNYVEKLKEINVLKTSNIYEGQQLKVPVYINGNNPG